MKRIFFVFLGILFFGIVGWAITPSVPHTFVNGEFADASDMNANFQALVQNLLEQQAFLPPVGGIIDYSGELETASGSVTDSIVQGELVWAKSMSNWIFCNGATVPEAQMGENLRDSNASIPGVQVPNLVGKFVKTVGPTELEMIGGAEQHLLALAHTHGISPCGGANGSNALIANGWATHVSSCNERSSTGTGSALSNIQIDNQPPYMGLFKLIRVK